MTKTRKILHWLIIAVAAIGTHLLLPENLLYDLLTFVGIVIGYTFLSIAFEEEERRQQRGQ